MSALNNLDQAVILSVKGSCGKRDHQSTGRALSYDETHELLAKCDRTSINGLRDALIILLGVRSGLRRTGIAVLKTSNLNFTDRSIRIIGKGNKLRNVYPSNVVWTLFTEWLAVRGEDGAPNVFCVVRKGENLDVRMPLTGNSIYQILRRA